MAVIAATRVFLDFKLLRGGFVMRMTACMIPKVSGSCRCGRAIEVTGSASHDGHLNSLGKGSSRLAAVKQANPPKVSNK